MQMNCYFEMTYLGSPISGTIGYFGFFCLSLDCFLDLGFDLFAGLIENNLKSSHLIPNNRVQSQLIANNPNRSQ